MSVAAVVILSVVESIVTKVIVVQVEITIVLTVVVLAVEGSVLLIVVRVLLVVNNTRLNAKGVTKSTVSLTTTLYVVV